MPDIRLRDVPEDLHIASKVMAARMKTNLQRLCLEILAMEVEKEKEGGDVT